MAACPRVLARLLSDRMRTVRKWRLSFSSPDIRRICASACLPAALSTLLTGLPVRSYAAAAAPAAPTEAAAAFPPPSLQAQIQLAARTSYVVLDLRDGRRVAGEFRGFVGDWRDTVNTAARYEAWRATQRDSLPMWGEELLVVRTPRDTLRGELVGTGPSLVVVRADGVPEAEAVLFYRISAMSAAAGRELAPWSRLRALLAAAPPMIGVALARGPDVIVVPRDEIVAAAGSGEGVSESNGIGILVAIVLGVIVCGAALQSATNDASVCAGNGVAETSSCMDDLQFALAGRPDSRFRGGDLKHGIVWWPAGEMRRP